MNFRNSTIVSVFLPFLEIHNFMLTIPIHLTIDFIDDSCFCLVRLEILLWKALHQIDTCKLLKSIIKLMFPFVKLMVLQNDYLIRLTIEGFRNKFTLRTDTVYSVRSCNRCASKHWSKLVHSYSTTAIVFFYFMDDVWNNFGQPSLEISIPWVLLSVILRKLNIFQTTNLFRNPAHLFLL